MSKRILSFILILCLCMSGMSGMKVYADEREGNDVAEVVTIENGDVGNQEIPEANEIVIPQNGSVVHMEGTQPQGVTYSLRKPTENTSERYIVLVLDTSSTVDFIYNGTTIYTANTALPYVKKASLKFIQDVQEAPGTNYIAIVTYSGTTSKIVSPFTDDINQLQNAINSLQTLGGQRSVSSGLTTAGQLMDTVSDENATKSVVLFTTGMTTAGEYSDTGKYDSFTPGGTWVVSDTGIMLYKFANSAYIAAEDLKDKATIYSIGLFHTFKNIPSWGNHVVNFFKRCACDWASSEDCFYDVKEPEKLEFAFGQVADNITNCTGTFSYPGEGKDYTSTYYYDDEYFRNTSYDYNQSLATMSLCLEFTTWGSAEESDYTKKMKNAKTLLNELGFDEFKSNYTEFSGDGIEGKPTMDSIGVVAANKQVCYDGEEYTLIALAVRGSTYEREWASNFTIGEEGEHRGFAQARDIIIDFLENYVAEQEISGNIKLWITGYSRGGAVANMVAGAIDDRSVDLKNCNYELKDVFAYTFETPAGVIAPEKKEERFDNIFNVINNVDLVPKVAPEEWDFGRYGIDKKDLIAEADGTSVYIESKTAMLEKYKEMDGYNGYTVDDFTMKKIETSEMPGLLVNLIIVDDKNNAISQGVFLQDFVTKLAREVLQSRKNYVENYQQEVRYALGMICGTDGEKFEELLDVLSERITDNWMILVEILLITDYDWESVYEILQECLEASLNEVGITGYTEEEFDATVSALSDILMEMAIRHPNLVTTFVMNFDGIIQGHYPELCLAWMQSMDPNYTTDAKTRFSTGKYRIVRVNCPVDVNVYDAEGNLLASIIKDEPQPDGAVVTAINEDGEKLVYLPVINDYMVKLMPTDAGVMNYAVQEYDPQAGENNHLVNFYEIQIAEGQEYTAYIPAYSEEEIQDDTGVPANTDYSLFVDGMEILPSEELSGQDAFNAYYNVSATTEDISKGIVLGSGIRQIGTFAKVTALAKEGYEFVGWYEDENMVSVELEYRIRVSEDVNLVARFKEAPLGEGSGEEPGEGSGEGPGEGSGEEPGEGSGEEPGEGTGEEPGEGTGEEPGEGSGEEPGEGTGEIPGEGGDEATKSGIEGMFKVVSQWNTSFVGEITLTNTTEEVIHNWTINFDFPYEITSLWDGVISESSNGTYTVQNAMYNWNINPGESVTFGFVANKNEDTEIITGPAYYTLMNKGTNAVSEGIEIAYKVNNDWGTAYIAQIEIKNVSGEEIFDWMLEFDYPNSINAFWDAEIISHDGNHYVIKNNEYNAVIEAGQTLVLEFDANCESGNSQETPENYKLDSVNQK